MISKTILPPGPWAPGPWGYGEILCPDPAGPGSRHHPGGGDVFPGGDGGSRLPTGSQERVSFIRTRAKDYLVTQLAGQITLSQFYRLLNLIEEEAGQYFAWKDWSGGKPGLGRPGRLAGPGPPLPETVKSEALRQALANLPCPRKAGARSPRRPFGNFSGIPTAAGFACWTSRPGLR